MKALDLGAGAGASRLLRVALAASASRGLCLALFLVAASRTELERYGDFLSCREGQSREERLAEIRTNPAERLAPFDGQFYLDIARRGYARFDEPPGGNFAFYPLYPMLLRILDSLGLPVPLVAASIGLLLSAGACAIVHRIAEGLAIPPWMPVALLLAFPSGVFQVLVYAESLFLFLSALLSLLSLQGPGAAATALGFLAGLSRPQGILASLLWWPIRMEGSRPRLEARRLLPFLSPILGWATYVGLVRLRVGSPLAFLEIQQKWGRSVSLLGPVRAICEALAGRAMPPDAICCLAGIAAIPLLFVSLPLPFALFGAGSVLLPLSTGRSLSMARFLSVAFPLFLAASKLLRRRPFVVCALVLLGAVLQIWFVRRLAGWQFAG